jgi:glycine betaine/proline transport system substrate-binding protein
MITKTLKARVFGLARLGAIAAFAIGIESDSPSWGAEVPESTDPIKIVMHDWTGQNLSVKVTGEILSRMGYNVEYVTSPMVPAMNAMGEGDLHLQSEQWLLSLLDLYEKLNNAGKVVNMGPLGLEGGETLYYPGYIEEKCPGLPNWEALKDCEEVFATTQTHPKGRLVDYPEEWTSEMPQRIDALGLEYEPIPAGGEGALIAEMKSAFERDAPLLINFYEPHWVFTEYDLRGVEFPEWDLKCEEDPSWGINPDKTFDCGGRPPRIDKVAWAGFAEKWPAAFRFMKSFTFTNMDQSPLTKRVDLDGESLDEVAKSWVDENESVWRPWVEDALKN